MGHWAWRKNGRPTLAVAADLRESAARQEDQHRPHLFCPEWGSQGATGQGVGLPSARRLVSTGSRTVPSLPSRRKATPTVAQSPVPKEQQSHAGPAGPNPEQPPENGQTGQRGSLSQTHQATRTPTERSYQELHGSAQEDRDGLEGRSWLCFSRKGIHFSVIRQGGPYLSVPGRLLGPP